MLSKFFVGALIGIIVVAVNYFTSPHKKMSVVKRIFFISIICIVSGLLYMFMP